MQFDLKKVREMYGYTQGEFARFMKIGISYYQQYESHCEIPSKYIYTLWKNLKDFPIPDDFFVYTSMTLLTNMQYHKMKQSQICELFGLKAQSTVSNYLKENVPLYELKDKFQIFDPLIVPFQAVIMNSPDGIPSMEFIPLTNLSAKGNMTNDFHEKRIEQGKRLRISNEQKKEVPKPE